MMYLIIMFCSPLYFLVRKKWGGFLLNSILYGIAVLLLVTLVFAFIAPLFWILGVGHAVWHLRHEEMERHATLIATKMVSAMTGAGVSVTTPPPTTAGVSVTTPPPTTAAVSVTTPPPTTAAVTPPPKASSRPIENDQSQTPSGRGPAVPILLAVIVVLAILCTVLLGKLRSRNPNAPYASTDIRQTSQSTSQSSGPGPTLEATPSTLVFANVNVAKSADQTATRRPPSVASGPRPSFSEESTSESTSSMSEQIQQSPTPIDVSSTDSVTESIEILYGERFPQTRTQTLTESDIAAWSLADIQYAINEIFARHGAEFPRDKQVAANFAQFSWYHPQPGLDFDKIEASLPATERWNVQVLGSARNTRRTVQQNSFTQQSVSQPSSYAYQQLPTAPPGDYPFAVYTGNPGFYYSPYTGRGYDLRQVPDGGLTPDADTGQLFRRPFDGAQPQYVPNPAEALSGVLQGLSGAIQNTGRAAPTGSRPVHQPTHQ